MFALFGWTDFAAIAVVVVVLFGLRRLPELWSGVRQGGREFGQAAADVQRGLRPKESGLVAEALTPDNLTAEFLLPKEEDEGVRSKLIVWVAQGFGVGRIPFAPGTWGSLLGVFWSLFLLVYCSPIFFVLLMALSVALAVWICGEAEKILGAKDPSSVVLDEIVAMPLVYAGIWLWQRPSGIGHGWSFWTSAELVDLREMARGMWPIFLGGFVLFRLFDIWKPGPIRHLQRLRGGWGVVVDDLAAAVVAGVVLFFGWGTLMYVLFRTGVFRVVT